MPPALCLQGDYPCQPHTHPTILTGPWRGNQDIMSLYSYCYCYCQSFLALHKANSKLITQRGSDDLQAVVSGNCSLARRTFNNKNTPNQGRHLAHKW